MFNNRPGEPVVDNDHRLRNRFSFKNSRLQIASEIKQRYFETYC